MIYAGANITSAADELKKINIDYLYNSIRFPKQKLESDIKQLRIIRQIDDKKYASLKCKQIGRAHV